MQFEKFSSYYISMLAAVNRFYIFCAAMAFRTCFIL